MNATTQVGIGLVIIVAIGGLVLWQKNANPYQVPVDAVSNSTSETQSPSQETAETPTLEASENETSDPAAQTQTETAVLEGSGITAGMVAAHNSRSSCWSTINGNVYDLTSWIPKHPGGEKAILQLCGTDGSAKFNGQHGGAPKQAAILAGFKIGVAVQ